MKHLLVLTSILLLNCSFLIAPNNINNDFREENYKLIQKESNFFKIYNESLQTLKEFEGLRLVPYQDSRGYSIGYGHFIKNYESFTIISEEKAEALLRVDFESAISSIERLTEFNRYDNPEKVLALAHFIFQFGEGSFANSTLLKNIVNDKAINNEIVRWTHVTINGEKKSLPSLEKRRKYELELFYS